MMRMIVVLLSLLLGACAATDTAPCAEPSDLARGVVKLNGTGSAFLTSASEMMTVRHVTSELDMTDAWQNITVSQMTPDADESWYLQRVLMRIKRVFTGLPEELHLLEMQKPLFWPTATLKLRETPLAVGERVTGVGYSLGKRAYAWGRFVDAAPKEVFLRGFSGFDLTDGDNGYPIKPGASGGIIADCEGHVVGALSKGIFYNPRRPGAPNIGGVPTYPIARAFAQ